MRRLWLPRTLKLLAQVSLDAVKMADLAQHPAGLTRGLFFGLGELPGACAQHPASVKRPAVLLAPFDQQPQPGAIPVEHLQMGAPPVAEHEQRATAKVLLEHLVHQRLQPLEALAQFAGLQRQEHLQAAGKAQYECSIPKALSRAAASLTCAASPISRRTPPPAPWSRRSPPLPPAAEPQHHQEPPPHP